MSESVKSPIFISYSRQDQAYVRKLISAFEAKGLSVWLDERIDFGADWQKVLEESLRACQVFVLMMTPRSLESHWVQCELSLALELKKPIFPLLLEGERWFGVANLQVVDVRSGSLPPDRFFLNVSTSVVERGIEEVIDVKPPDIAITVSTDTSSMRRKTAQLVEPQPVSVDARYAKLEQYLKDKQWKKADDETYRLMITEVGNEEGQWFIPNELPNSPCEPLRAIDGLWVKHSDGQFGFSVQKEMYLEYGGVADGQYDKSGAFNKLCEVNGWKVDGKWVNVVFDTSSPKGHLPCFRLYIGSDMQGRGRRSQRFSALISRLVSCNL